MNALSRFSVLCAFFVAVIPSTAGAGGDPVNGKVLYSDHCASCHGGTPIPDQFSRMGANNVKKIQNQIATNPQMMTPDLEALTVGQITDIAAYLGTFVAPPPAADNYQGIWWNSSESGWGINLAHQADTIFASWFTYDTTGKGWWLVMTAPKVGTGVYQGHLLATHGPRFDAFDTTKFQFDDVGTGTLTFTDVNTGSFHYHINNGPVDQTKSITRQVFGTLPTCATAAGSLAAATNYQDLWWVPGGAESGWGINLNHESNTIFATWFTYDIDGTPMWLVMTASGPAFSGDLLRTHGPRFDAYDTTQFKFDKVGTASLTFADGNNASFHYDITGVGPAEVVQTKSITRQVFAGSGTTCQ